MSHANPYQKALIPGVEVGTAVSDPVAVANIIKHAENPLVVFGTKSLEKFDEGRTYADFMYELGKKINAEIVVTTSVGKYFSEKGIKDVYYMPLINLIDRLRDPDWINIRGEGKKYDLIIIGGFLYYFLSQMLSTIKNYTTYRTLCLDRYHQPSARFSFPNLEKEEWVETLKTVMSKL